MTNILPFATHLNDVNGIIEGAPVLIQRTLRQMVGMYHDETATQQALQESDRLVYEVYASGLPEEDGHILYCTTIIHPGTVGDEYHMTKGHYHQKRNEGEVYVGLQGEGYLLLQTAQGAVSHVPMHKGTIAYVPPHWAHRTVNVGKTPFIFFAVWAGDAGHDYATIETQGFPVLVVERDGSPVLVDNPRWQASGS